MRTLTKTLTIVAATSLCSTSALAESLIIKGSLRTELPKVVTTQTAVPVSNVKDFKLTLGSDAGICELTTDQTYAKKSVNIKGKWICLVEWDTEKHGLSPTNLDLTGVLNKNGTINFGYKLSVYSAGQQYPLLSDTIASVVTQPVAPKITDYALRWSKRSGQSLGTNQWNYERANGLTDVTVIVEPRPYPQKIEADGISCTVAENAPSCLLKISKEFTSEQLKQGVLPVNGIPKDTKGFFASTAPNQLKINWDFREPEIAKFAMNTKADGSALPVSYSGVNLTLTKDEAVVFVKSPHINNPDTWWKPKDMSMVLALGKDIKLSDLDDIKGSIVRYKIPNYSSSTEYRVKPTAEPTIQNGMLVYKYDLSKIPDAKFDLKVRAEDVYANTNEFIQTDTLIDRYAPDIQILNLKTLVNGKSDLYFTKDLTIAASSGWEDGTTITSVKFNGLNSTMTGDSTRIKSPAHSEFSVDSDVNLVVTAVDGAGNTAVKTFDFRYMPIDFELTNVPDSIYSDVEGVKMRLKQTKGIKCKTSSSDELAVLQARGVYKGCTVQWGTLPKGLETITYPTGFGLEGGIEGNGDILINWTAYLHDAEGNRATAKTGVSKVKVLPAPKPTLSLSTMNKLEDGVYGVSHNSNQITRYEINTVPADNVLHVKASNGEIDEEVLLSQRLTKKPYSIRNLLKRPAAPGKMAWDKTTYTVNAYHRRVPSSKSSQTFDLITFPDGGIRASLTLDESQTTNANTVNAKLKIGRPANNSYVYEIPKMGSWNGYLAIRANGKYQAITGVTKLDDNGEASFVVNANEVFKKGNAIYAIVDAISPYEKYKRTLVSTSAKLNVLKAEAIEGTLTARTQKGKVPFSTTMTFNYGTTEDRNASEPVGWEQSNNGVDWSILDVKAGQKLYSTRITDVGVMYYRVKMQNRMTSVQSYTEPLRIVGYDTADIWIEGNDFVYPGSKAQLTLFAEDSVDIAEDGFAEWSVDGGVTWVAGDNFREVTVAENMKVMARYRLNSTDDVVGDEGYIQTSHRITTVPLEPLKIKASAPKQAEVGTTVTLTGTAAHRNSAVTDKIIGFWKTPSGEILNAMNAQYTIKEADIQDGNTTNFTFTAYVEKYEAQTKSTANVLTNIWEYTLPDIGLTLMSRIQIAPATFVARVDAPYFYAPGVELKYQWVLPAGVEITKETSTLTYLVSKMAGVHKVGIRVSDNRGNEKLVSEFIDIVDADPLTMGMEVRPSNIFERAPVSYSVRTNAKPGHPDDKMKSYTWFLDGKELEGQIRPYSTVAFEVPGTYKLKVKFTTAFGQVGEMEQDITVVPNQPPICEPTLAETTSSVTVISNCTDPDGKIISIKYIWRDDGYESSGGTRLRFTKSLHDNLNVTIRATDDSGAETVANIKWANPTANPN